MKKIMRVLSFVVFMLVFTACGLYTTPDTWTPDEKFVYKTNNTLITASSLRKSTLSVLNGMWNRGLITNDVALDIVEVGDTLQSIINEISKDLAVFRHDMDVGISTEIQYIEITKKVAVFHDVLYVFIEKTNDYTLDESVNNASVNHKEGLAMSCIVCHETKDNTMIMATNIVYGGD